MRSFWMLIACACGATYSGPADIVVVAPAEPRAVRAAVVDGAGRVLGRCEGELGCLVPLDGVAPGVVRVQVGADGRVLHRDVELRGTEVALDIEGASGCIVREQRTAGLVLHLAAEAPSTADLPVITLDNRTGETLHGTGPNALMVGALYRSDGGTWVQVGGSVGCGVVMGWPIPPGGAADVDAPDYLGPRPAIVPEARYRFVIEVSLGDADERGCPTDTAAASIELIGAEILAQAAPP